MTIAMKPCPWCGAAPEVFHAPDQLIYVGCTNDDDKCSIVVSTRGHFQDRDAAIRAWNNRYVPLIVPR